MNGIKISGFLSGGSFRCTLFLVLCEFKRPWENCVCKFKSLTYMFLAEPVTRKGLQP